MSRQVITERPIEIQTFSRLMRAHAVLRRELAAEVLTPRGLTITREELDEGLAILDDALAVADEYVS